MMFRTAPRFIRTAGFGLALIVVCAPVQAGERFLSIPLSNLRYEDDRHPSLPLRTPGWSPWATDGGVNPYAVLDRGGEVYLDYGSVNREPWSNEVSALSVRTEAEDPLRGRLFVPDPAQSTVSVYRFEVTAPSADVDARTRYFESMETHYDRLLARGIPGAAWFRHRRGEAQRALERKTAALDPDRLRREPADPLDLFTGARAVAENLDLDRNLREASSDECTIEIDSIRGVVTASLDWKALIKDLTPAFDPLAKLIPADQHAVFFPSFEAMVRVFDGIDEQGTPVLEFFQARVEDLKTKERYQEQMCLPFSTLGRVLGPAIVSSVAVTGSDPFLPSGSDVVVLFDCKQPGLLEGFLKLRQGEAVKAGAEHVEGNAGGAHYVGAVSKDRRISAYMARFENTVAVSNSLVGLMHVAGTSQDSTRSLLSADEYVWFRDRYRRGDAQESALIVLTDATIRRWAGPRSRIADARRLRAAAAMAEIQARHVDQMAAGKIDAGSSASDPEFPVSADFVWTEAGVHSPRWGNLSFLTPTCELGVERVSPGEKQAYEAFRGTFQRLWRNYFDPIAMRLAFDSRGMAADVTIRPLTIDSEYREIEQLTRGATLAPKAGDPHEGALFHYANGFNKTSDLGRMLADSVGPLAASFGADPLSWMGSSIALYGERDPWWDETRAAGGLFEGDDVNYYAIPLVLQCDVKDPLKLAGFLTALRVLADQSAPNLTKWENRTWQETGYVRIAASEDLGISAPDREAALYYVALPDVLVLSLREDLIKKAIDRRKARKAGEPIAGSDRAWLGSSAGLRLDRDAIDLVSTFRGARVDPAAVAAWSTIPILNEWKRRFPNEDPVALHERLFGTRLRSPSGGSPVWNEEFQTMESVEFGWPGAPRYPTSAVHVLGSIKSAELGLTFEGEGLRAVVQLTQSR